MSEAALELNFYKKMEKIKAIIERAEDGGFGIYSKEIPGLVGYGLHEDEAREDFACVMEEQIEYQKKTTGTVPDWAENPVEYHYDLSAFFQAFPFINATQFAREIGINPSLMRKYKMGLASASEKQKKLIEEHLKAMIEKLQRVEF